MAGRQAREREADAGEDLADDVSVPGVPLYRIEPRRERRRELTRRFAMLVAASALVWLLVMLIGGDSGALAFVRARGRLATLEEQVRALEAENARLREAVRELRHDDAAVVKLAREELMMARPDEEVVLVPDPKPRRSPPHGAEGAEGAAPVKDPASGRH